MKPFYILFTSLFLLFSFNIYSQKNSSVEIDYNQTAFLDVQREMNQLNSSIASNPYDQYSKYKLALLHIRIRKYSDAMTHLLAAKDRMKDSAIYHLTLFNLAKSMGTDKLADYHFDNYTKLSSNSYGLEQKMTLSSMGESPKVLSRELSVSTFYPYPIHDNHIQMLHLDIDSSETSQVTDFAQYLTTSYSNKEVDFIKTRSFNQVNEPKGYLNGPFCLNRTLDKIYITRWDPIQKRLFIYFSSYSKDKWSKFISINIPNSIGKNYLHPMLSSKGDKLYFVSDMSGGMGGYDIWMGNIYSDTILGNIQNLGSEINSPGDECFPSITKNNDLIFASNGRYGFGGLDLYISKAMASKYSPAQNLGTSFNTNSDEFAAFPLLHSHTLLYTSNRLISKETRRSRIFKQNFEWNSYKILNSENKLADNTPIETVIPSEPVTIAQTYPTEIKTEKTTSTEVTSPSPTSNEKVSFILLTHPYQKPVQNTFYRVLNAQNQVISTGNTNEKGEAYVKYLSENVEYKIDVPNHKFIKNNVMFDELSTNVLYVKSDVVEPSDEIAFAPKTPSGDQMTESYSMLYENNKWKITEKVERIIEYKNNPNAKPIVGKVIVEKNQSKDFKIENSQNQEATKQSLESAKEQFMNSKKLSPQSGSPKPIKR